MARESLVERRSTGRGRNGSVAIAWGESSGQGLQIDGEVVKSSWRRSSVAGLSRLRMGCQGGGWPRRGGVCEAGVCGHHCAYKKGGASRVDGVPWNWPGGLQQKGSMDCKAQALAVVCAPVALCLHPRRRHAPPLPACRRSALHRPRVGDPSPAVGWSVAGLGPHQ